MNLLPGTTLFEAQQALKKSLDSGTDCPCCGQFAMRYPRTLYSTMARALIKLHQLTGGDTTKYVHKNEIMFAAGFVNITGDFAKFRWWELAYEMEKDPDNKMKRTSGMWHITEKGCQFVKGEISVPRGFLIYNNKVEGFSDETPVTIKECLGENFNYAELMGRVSAQ